MINTLDQENGIPEIVITKDFTIMEVLHKMRDANCEHAYLISENENKMITFTVLQEALNRGYSPDTTLLQLEFSMLLEKKQLFI